MTDTCTAGCFGEEVIMLLIYEDSAQGSCFYVLGNTCGFQIADILLRTSHIFFSNKDSDDLMIEV